MLQGVSACTTCPPLQNSPHCSPLQRALMFQAHPQWIRSAVWSYTASKQCWGLFLMTSMHANALWSGGKKILCVFIVSSTLICLLLFLPHNAAPSLLRASLWSSCVVLPLLALTWMSAVLAMTDKRSILFQILFAVFDSLQGFVIVMVHCILRREVEDDLMFAWFTYYRG